MRQNDDFVAQLVEQLTLNQWAVGSSPTEVTKKPPMKVGGFIFALSSGDQQSVRVHKKCQF